MVIEVTFEDNSVAFTGVCLSTSALVTGQGTNRCSLATSIGARAPPGVTSGAADFLIMHGIDCNVTLSTAQMVTNASKLAPYVHERH